MGEFSQFLKDDKGEAAAQVTLEAKVNEGQMQEPLVVTKDFILPQYVSDDVNLGVAGTRSIYRWNNTGAIVIHDFRGGGFAAYTVHPVEFTGGEITSYTIGGEPVTCGSEEAVQEELRKHKS